MKKILCASILAALSCSSHASHTPMQPYVGLDYVIVSPNYTQDMFSHFLPTNVVGGSPYLGVLFNQYFGFEVSYLQTKDKIKSTTNTSVKLKFDGYAADFIGQLPLTTDATFLLVGSLGAADLRGKAELTSPGNSVKAAESKIDYRIGAGFQYQFTDQFGIRTKAYYSPLKYNAFGPSMGGSSADVVNYVMTYTAGLIYRF